METTQTGAFSHDLETALRGMVSTGVRTMLEEMAAALAKRWWRSAEGAPTLSTCIREHLIRAGTRFSSESPGLCERFVEVWQQRQAWDMDDAVLDPLVASLDGVWRQAGWDKPPERAFIRCFLMEIALVEGHRMECDRSGALGAAAGGTLKEFTQRKAKPIFTRALRDRGADLDYVIAGFSNALLGLDAKWNRKTWYDFDRAQASLGAFVVRMACYHVRDILRLPEPQWVPLPVTPGEDGDDRVVPDCGEPALENPEALVDDVLDASVTGTPVGLDPSKPTGRKRLVLLEGYLKSLAADEDFDTHTCPDGTRQLKFVFTQGAPPALVLGSLGGNSFHPRSGTAAPDRAKKDHSAATQGFAPGSCRVRAVDAAQAWLHWRVLYTVAFYSAATRAGLLPDATAERGAGVAIDTATLRLERLRRLCLRRCKAEPDPSDEDVNRVLADYQDWIRSESADALFSVTATDTLLQPAHRYPNVLLSSYAPNPFCAIYATFRLDTPMSVDDLRFEMKALRQALREKGTGHGQGRR